MPNLSKAPLANAETIHSEGMSDTAHGIAFGRHEFYCCGGNV